MPTAIQWTDETFNPWWGCDKVSPGCAHCYAEKVSNHRTGPGLWGPGHSFRFFGDSHWAEPLRWNRKAEREGRRIRVFCASMADVFEERPELDEHRERLFALIEETPHLDWQVLTKRPEFARDWLLRRYVTIYTSNSALRSCDPLLPNDVPNLWVGVSIENARFTWRADVLRQIPAAVRFISAEPLLGSLFPVVHDDDLRSLSPHRAPLDLSGIDWVIIGGESGPGARPFHLEHAREIIRACRAESSCNPDTGCDCHEVGLRPAIFVKQLGAKPVVGGVITKRSPLLDRKGGDWDEWPPDLRIREFPRTAVTA